MSLVLVLVDCIGNQFPTSPPTPTTPTVTGGSSEGTGTTVPGEGDSSSTPGTTEASQETTPNSAAILGVGLPFLLCVWSTRLL
jgi:hypothetical protein